MSKAVPDDGNGRAATKGPVVLVTGANSLIGTAVCRALAQGYRVVGFDRSSAGHHPPPEAECVCMDITDQRSMDLAMQRIRYAYGERIASVVHLADYHDFSGEPSPEYQRVDVEGTQRLLRALHGEGGGGGGGGFEVGQFILSSTMLVHAPCQPGGGERINEDWPLEPKWPHPEFKLKAEGVVREERGPIPALILRIAGVYNDHCRAVTLAHQMQRVYERWMTATVFPGDVTHGQAFVHLDDTVNAIRLAVDRRAELPPETTLLIGEEETLSYDELQRTFAKLLHGEDAEEWETKEISKAVAKTGAWVQEHLPWGHPFIKPWMIDLADDHYALDTTRAREMLGWRPQRSLRDTLPKMAAFLKDDPEGFYRENKLEQRHPAPNPAQMHDAAFVGGHLPE